MVVMLLSVPSSILMMRTSHRFPVEESSVTALIPCCVGVGTYCVETKQCGGMKEALGIVKTAPQVIANVGVTGVVHGPQRPVEESNAQCR